MMDIPLESLLLQAFGEVKQDSIPLASVLCRLEPQYIQDQLQSSPYLMVAHPIYMELQRDAFALSEVLCLEEEAYSRWTEEFNHYFSENGIRFIPSACFQHWFVSFPNVLQARTTPLSAVLSQSISGKEIQGEDALEIMRLQNELQMLLHEHPLNLARLELGLAPVSSLWLSGEGTFAPRATKTSHLVGQNLLVKALAEISEIPCYQNWKECLQQKGVKNVVAVTHSLEEMELEVLNRLLNTWRIKTLSVFYPYKNKTVKITLHPWDKLKFWRSNKGLPR